MKKITALFAALVLLITLCACGSTAPAVNDPPEAPMPATEPIAETPTPVAEPVDDSGVRAELKKSYPGVLLDFERDEDGTIIVSSQFEGDDLYRFGDLIYMSLKAVETQFTNYRASLSWEIKNKTGSIIFEGTLSDGRIIDSRGGDVKLTAVHSPKDIASVFPALMPRLNAEANGVSAEEYRMYEVVMFRLETNISMSEQEVFEMTAPEYGMTAEELENWVREMMEKMY